MQTSRCPVPARRSSTASRLIPGYPRPPRRPPSRRHSTHRPVRRHRLQRRRRRHHSRQSAAEARTRPNTVRSTRCATQRAQPQHVVQWRVSDPIGIAGVCHQTRVSARVWYNSVLGGEWYGQLGVWELSRFIREWNWGHRKSTETAQHEPSRLRNNSEDGPLDGDSHWRCLRRHPRCAVDRCQPGVPGTHNQGRTIVHRFQGNRGGHSARPA